MTNQLTPAVNITINGNTQRVGRPASNYKVIILVPHAVGNEPNQALSVYSATDAKAIMPTQSAGVAMTKAATAINPSISLYALGFSGVLAEY